MLQIVCKVEKYVYFYITIAMKLLEKLSKMNTTITKPTPEFIMSFTQEQVEKLPSYTNVDKLPVGSYAKRGWMKAPSSLALIVRNEVIEKGYGTIAYVMCNIFNGVVSDTCYVGSAYKRNSIAMGDYYIIQGMNPDNITFAEDIVEPEDAEKGTE